MTWTTYEELAFRVKTGGVYDLEVDAHEIGFLALVSLVYNVCNDTGLDEVARSNCDGRCAYNRAICVLMLIDRFMCNAPILTDFDCKPGWIFSMDVTHRMAAFAATGLA